MKQSSKRDKYIRKKVCIKKSKMARKKGREKDEANMKGK
jgi:hypothetical protein